MQSYFLQKKIIYAIVEREEKSCKIADDFSQNKKKIAEEDIRNFNKF